MAKITCTSDHPPELPERSPVEAPRGRRLRCIRTEHGLRWDGRSVLRARKDRSFRRAGHGQHTSNDSNPNAQSFGALEGRDSPQDSRSTRQMGSYHLRNQGSWPHYERIAPSPIERRYERSKDGASCLEDPSTDGMACSHMSHCRRKTRPVKTS